MWFAPHFPPHCPKANFGPLSRGSITNPILIDVFDTYLSLGLSQDPSDSECSALTHFSMNLARKYVNLKRPYNQDIAEQVTTINFLKNKTDFTWNPQLQRQSMQKVFFKLNPLFVVSKNNKRFKEYINNPDQGQWEKRLTLLDLWNLLTINLIWSLVPKTSPKKFSQKRLFPHAKLSSEKSSPILCTGGRDTMLYLQISSHF